MIDEKLDKYLTEKYPVPMTVKFDIEMAKEIDLGPLAKEINKRTGSMFNITNLKFEKYGYTDNSFKASESFKLAPSKDFGIWKAAVAKGEMLIESYFSGGKKDTWGFTVTIIMQLKEGWEGVFMDDNVFVGTILKAEYDYHKQTWKFK